MDCMAAGLHRSDVGSVTSRQISVRVWLLICNPFSLKLVGLNGDRGAEF
jgi:hypothetical protein